MTRLTVALSGDCMATRGPLFTAATRAVQLRDLLRAADFAVTNLEVVPDAGRGHPAHDPVGGCLLADAAVLDAVAEAGFDVLSCANNHALDLGPDGVLGTMALLADRRLPYAGIGADLTAARMPVYVDRPAGSLALISCAASFGPGQQAADPSPQVRGRPGLNPLRYGTTVDVTAEQLATLRAIDDETGLRARRAETVALFGLDPARIPPGSVSLAGTRFRAAAAPGLATACDDRDVEEICRWVREARQRADLVAVSVHSHEPGDTPEQPAGHLRAFAHRVVDEGADLLFAHGPHLLRGVELHHDKPIFYSLGNIVSQIELADRVAAEDYAKMPASEPLTPARYFALRGGHDRRLFGAHRRYWRTVVPVLAFEDGRLVEARLYPVELGFGEPVHRRGRPRLAEPAEARDILTTLADLSAPFGTAVTVRDSDLGPVAHLPVVDGSRCRTA